MAMQVLLRRTCVECEGQGCPRCEGKGWIEFWYDLERLVKSIRAGEPIVPAVNLGVQSEFWHRAGEGEKNDE